MRTERLNIKEISILLNSLKNKYCPDDKTLELIESDLCRGFDTDDINKYCSRNMSFIKRKIISECINRGYSDEDIKKITSGDIKDDSLEVIYLLINKGVKIAVIENIAPSHDKLLDYYEKLKNNLISSDDLQESSVSEEIKNDSEDSIEQENNGEKDICDETDNEEDAAKSVSEMETYEPSRDGNSTKNDTENKEKACEDEHRIDKRSETEIKEVFKDFLDEFGKVLTATIKNGKNYEESKYIERIEALEKKIDMRDDFIRKQFNKINELSSYKVKSDNLEYELKSAEDVLERYKRLLEEESQKDVKTVSKEASVLNSKDVEVNKEDAYSDENDLNICSSDKDNNNDIKIVKNNESYNQIHDYDNIVQFTDALGRRHSSVLECSNQSNSGFGKALAAFAYKKKSRRSLMRLVMSGELSNEQLKYIVSAIKSGLTEEQLCSLIENKVPADKMPQIIEIAVLENSMGYTA